MRYIISMEVVSSSRDSYPSLTKCFEKNTSLSVPTDLFYENTCITLKSCRKEKSVIFEKVSGNFFLKSYILNMIDFLKDIFHINSLKRCLAHVERFIKDCSGLRPTVLDKRSLLRDGGKEV